ncbi:MAG: hypothetical protein LBF56_00870 [Holosporales bacterium]|nr:hypothetical protein [Holosporales bacterium]
MQKSCTWVLLTVLVCDAWCSDTEEIESGFVNGSAKITMQGPTFVVRGGGQIILGKDTKVIGDAVKIEPGSTVSVIGGPTYVGPATLEAGPEGKPVLKKSGDAKDDTAEGKTG